MSHTPEHVAMVVRSFSQRGGLELYTHKLVEGLLNRGIKVTVVCQDLQDALAHKLISYRQFQAPAKGARKGQRIRHYLEVATDAVRQLKGIDLIHSQHLPVVGADVVTFHNHTTAHLSQVGLTWERLLNRLKCELVPAYRLRRQSDLMLCRQAKCLVFPARICVNDFFTAFSLPDATPYVVAHPGVDPAGSPAGEVVEAERPFTFLFVGRGYRKKGLDILLRACSMLKKQGIDFRLNIAGLSEKLIDTARLALLGIQGKVHYLGFRPDMASVFASSSVLVLPSRVEPFGMAPIEAMHWGVVPIVSSAAGVSEVITHEHDGLILRDYLCPIELAELMRRLIESPELLAQLSERARATVKHITWNHTVEQTLAAYDLALSRKCPGPAVACD